MHKQFAIFLIENPNFLAARRQIIADFSMYTDGNLRRRQHLYRDIRGARNRRSLGVDLLKIFHE